MSGVPMTESKSVGQYTVIDLFAGCGGMTQGFLNMGFRPALAVEWELAAAATYASNFGEDHVFWGDIAELPSAAVPEADVVIGGPPCQGFSNLGTRDPDDPRNKLWREYVRVVSHARPKIFVIENVDRFRSSHEFGLLVEEVESGTLQDYTIEVGILNAADFGVPQRRRRTIVVGSRVGQPELPIPRFSQDGTGDQAWRTVRHALSGVPFDTDTTDLPDSQVEFFGQSVPGAFKAQDLHLGRNPRPLSLQRYDVIPPGGGRFDLPDKLMPDCWRNKPSGTTDVMGRMRWDAPSLTIRTEFFKPEKGQYLHPEWSKESPSTRVNRPITHWEAARLQGFPDDFTWCGKKIEIARQIGNAVPVGLGEAVASAVVDQLEAPIQTLV
jgi:DNA (cytosine-5)-methyltransferase 1